MSTENEITVYGANCRRAKRIQDERQAPFRWVDIDRDREGEKFVSKTNRGNRSIPTIVFADGSILVELSNAELPAKLFKTQLI